MTEQPQLENPAAQQSYADWIKSNVTETYGKCAEITKAMADEFPELTRVRGHYYCIVWGERAHWWLVAEDGSIVDPAASQFPSRGNGEYIQWGEGDIEPTGMCANCGDAVYDGGVVCSDKCHAEYRAFCMGV